MTLKPVFCVWKDAANEASWTTADEARELELAEIHTLGWLIVEDAERLVVAASWDADEGGALCPLAIPKGWILSLKHLPPIEL